MSAQENWIYPSAFEPCVLTATMVNGKPECTLRHLTSGEIEHPYLSFTDKTVCEGEQSIMQCDVMQSKDGGKPYLMVTNVEKVGKRSFSDVTYGVKFELASIVTDRTFFDPDDTGNTYRLRKPPLFHASEIKEFQEYILPNFYAKVLGGRFFH